MQKHQTAQLASFVLGKQYEDLPDDSIDQLKRHLLDSLGSLFYALQGPPIKKMARQIRALQGGGPCRVPLLGQTTVDRAAQLFTALTRYPDFMDNFLGKEATCHPSDNIGALLAVATRRNISAKDFLLAMALGYQVECRLVEEIPVMMKGFDHTVLLGISLTAAVSRLLGLDESQTAHAIAIAGCSLNPLVTSRASYTYEWKGLASSFVAQASVNFAMLAREGLTGPLSLFEGPKGYKEIFDMELEYDWSKEDFSLIRKCSLKGFNSEVHTQSALEAICDLRQTETIVVSDIKEIEITTFLTAFHIVGGGAYGERTCVHSKEQADHSLAYVAAVLLLDGEVYPVQLLERRIDQPDVQALLKKVKIHTGSPVHKPLIIAGLLDPYTQAYPEKLCAKVVITLRDGRKLTAEKEDYHGYYTRPLGWKEVAEKFNRLSAGALDPQHRERMITLCKNLENENFEELLDLITTASLATETI
jgi:2-methylcitrate dehydratase